MAGQAEMIRYNTIRENDCLILPVTMIDLMET